MPGDKRIYVNKTQAIIIFSCWLISTLLHLILVTDLSTANFLAAPFHLSEVIHFVPTFFMLVFVALYFKQKRRDTLHDKRE